MAEPKPFHVIRDGLIYELQQLSEGGFFISVAQLPGCTSFGETIDEALTQIRDAIDLWIEFAREQGLDVPDEIQLKQAS